MKFFQKRAVAAVVLILAIVAGVVIGQAKKPDTGGQASTAIVGSYTYVYDYAGVLTDETMEHIDAMNASLFAQTGAQILVSVVNSTGGADIMDYASDLGNSYGVGSAERNNGVVMLLALDNISQSGLMGDYCVVVGTGLESHADDFMSLQSYYLENDFAAGEYDAGVKATFDAFIAWFADFYGVTIREGYIPAVRETYSSGSGYYYTETHGYVAPALGSLVSGVVVLLVVLLVLWVILDGMRDSRDRRGGDAAAGEGGGGSVARLGLDRVLAGPQAQVERLRHGRFGRTGIGADQPLGIVNAHAAVIAGVVAVAVGTGAGQQAQRERALAVGRTLGPLLCAGAREERPRKDEQVSDCMFHRSVGLRVTVREASGCGRSARRGCR